MKIEEIEIYSGTPDFDYEAIRRLEVKCEASNALMPAPTIDEANGRLRALAAKVGANAIIEADYNSGVSFTSWKSLKATGLAVRKVSDEVQCPYCAETIKRAAIKCRHCGSELPEQVDKGAAFTPENGASPGSNVPASEEPLRDSNNPAILIALVGAAVLVVILVLSAG